MKQLRNISEHFTVLITLLRWTILVLPVAITAGSAVALFLWLLDMATQTRWQNPWLLYLLPIAGIAIYFVYKLFGKNSEKGNNLILEEIHQPGGGVPLRMAPLVLFGTVITHLFGGSAGREGTAVQMGGSIAATFGKWFKLDKKDMRIILTAGIAAGFGAVFGTPVTGTVFALEVLTIGSISYQALFPSLIASVVGNLVCNAWGVHHTQYHINITADNLPFITTLLKTIVTGVACGLAGFLFSELTHRLKTFFQQTIKQQWLIPVAGGCIIIALTYIIGTTDYLGLGVTSNNPHGISIVNAFMFDDLNHWAWLWKLLFTVITLSAGFKGGEVTPLFFIGAMLGNALATWLHAPVDLFAGIGFIAVFAGAANTPLACTIMGVELFGGTYILYFAVACFISYFFSGHSGIYTAQKIGIAKITDERFTTETSLQQSIKRRIKFTESFISKWKNKQKNI